MQMSGLRLDRAEDAMRGGYSGAVIVPGKSGDSRLIQMVAGAVEGSADTIACLGARGRHRYQ